MTSHPFQNPANVTLFLGAFFIALCTASLLPWIMAGWLRPVRYIGYFQHQSYRTNDYLTWLFHSKDERKHFLHTFFVMLIVLILALYPMLSRWDQSLICAFPFLNVILTWAVGNFSAPQTHDVPLEFASTGRALRLIMTAGIVQTFLPIIICISLCAYSFKVQNLPFAAALLGLATTSGVLVYLLLPLMPPLANLINWPIDRLLRAPRNAPTSQGSNL